MSDLQIKTQDLMAFKGTLAEELLDQCRYPWEALKDLGEYIEQLCAKLPREEYSEISPTVFVHKSVQVADFATLKGPCLIGPQTEIRPGAFLRGRVLVGQACVLGNSCEMKNTLMLDHVQAPHYNYTGDSIFGNWSHLGAGAICSNVKADHSLIVVHGDEIDWETNLKKMGAILGDHAEVGCNSVLNPGTVVGTYTRIYPLSQVRGIIPSHTIYKSKTEWAEIEDWT